MGGDYVLGWMDGTPNMNLGKEEKYELLGI